MFSFFKNNKVSEVITEVAMFKNGVKERTFNDPSDAEDYMITHIGLPRGFMLEKEPHFGYGWVHLPFRFGWKENFYVFERSHIDKG